MVHDGGGHHSGEAEIAKLYRITEKKHVAGLDVAVLDGNQLAVNLVFPGVEKIESISYLSQEETDMLQGQRLARICPMNFQKIKEAALGQLHGNDDVA